ncbi:hypothetical protein ISS07_05145 [Candidatus Woesearchaeota archaeon]|nr:hypothetical protein [Candidatus Woesearchaeota archaeon]
MRRRRGSGEKAKKFMVYFMAVLMVGSLFGIVFLGFSSGGDGGLGTIEYKDFEFINRGDHWSLDINKVPALFTYLPTDLELILVEEGISSKLQNRIQVDVTSNFNSTLAESIALAHYQMTISFANFNIFSRAGFIEETETALPKVTCEDSTQAVPVIYFKEGNETKIYSEDTCIIAQASSHADIIRIKDRIMYSIFGVMQ